MTLIILFVSLLMCPSFHPASKLIRCSLTLTVTFPPALITFKVAKVEVNDNIMYKKLLIDLLALNFTTSLLIVI